MDDQTPGTTFETLRARFAETFPAGFDDALFVFEERGQPGAVRGRGAHVDRAIDAAREALSPRALDAIVDAKGVGLYAALERIVRLARGLVFRIDAARFADQWKEHDGELAVALALRDLLYRDDEPGAGFDAWCAALRPDVARQWAMVTLVPALADPERFAFVRPKYWRAIAESVDCPAPRAHVPSAEAYREYLAIARELRSRFGRFELRDLFDAWSFAFRTSYERDRHARVSLAPLSRMPVPPSRRSLVLEARPWNLRPDDPELARAVERAREADEASHYGSDEGITVIARVDVRGELVILDVATGAIRRLRLPVAVAPSGLAVASDGRSIAVFERSLWIVDVQRTSLRVRACALGGEESLGGEFTPDREWLLFADRHRIYGWQTRGSEVTTIATCGDARHDGESSDAEGPTEPRRLDEDGARALVTRGRAIEVYDVAALTTELRAAPVVGYVRRAELA